MGAPRSSQGSDNSREPSRAASPGPMGTRLQPGPPSGHPTTGAAGGWGWGLCQLGPQGRTGVGVGGLEAEGGGAGEEGGAGLGEHGGGWGGGLRLEGGAGGEGWG